MRQREDAEFATALNNMVDGHMTNNDIELIKQRIVPESDIPNEAIHLFPTNADVNNFNTLKLAGINSEELFSTTTAKDRIKALTLSDGSKQQILESVKSFKTSETQDLSYELLLKISAKYMITVNINTTDGLVNGASGQLMAVDCGESYQILRLWIKFTDDSVGIIARAKTPHPRESTWTPIEKVVRAFQYKKNEHVSIERQQFPVVPAEAITIHKSQGATYQMVVVHLKPGMTRSAIYVAFSRATNRLGLFVVGVFIPPKPRAPNDAVQQELNKLRNEKVLKTHYEYLLQTNDTCPQVYYQNVQSFPAHYNDIKNDQIIRSCNILCFVETWNLPGEEFNIDGFSIAKSMSGQLRRGPGRPANGIIVYVKQEMAGNFQILFDKNICRRGQVLQLVCFKYLDTIIITLYRNSRFPIREFREEVLNEIRRVIDEQTGKIVLLGDFNICRLVGRDELERQLNELGVFSLLSNESTTKQNTHIDWLFSNDRTAKGLTYETVFSHHDGIFYTCDN